MFADRKEIKSCCCELRNGKLYCTLAKKEVKECCCHPKTLQKMARNGGITGIQIGKLWRFRPSALNEWLEIRELISADTPRPKKQKLRYGASRRFAPFRQGGPLFKRTTHQQGSLKLEERKRAADVWVYRWWDTDSQWQAGIPKQQVGGLECICYPPEKWSKKALHLIASRGKSVKL